MRAVSLLYHDVIPTNGDRTSGFPGSDADAYKLEQNAFRRHLRLLADTLRDPPATVDDVLRGAAGRVPWLLTFDDGGVSAAGPIAGQLDAQCWRAHFFVTTGFIGTEGFLSKEQIVCLRNAGHTIGTHSVSHPDPMARCPYTQMVDEWHRSSETLAEILDQPVRCGSIPGGAYSRRVAAAAAEVGLEALFTSEPTPHLWQVDGCRVFGRYCFRQGMDAKAVAALARGDLWPHLQTAVAWNSKKVIKRIGGPLFYRIRRYLVRRNTV